MSEARHPAGPRMVSTGAQSCKGAAALDSNAMSRGAAQDAPHVSIRIDRISIPGISAASGQRFSRALAYELGQLIRDKRDLAALQSMRVEHISAGSLRAGATPEDAARQVASSLLKTLDADGGKRRREAPAQTSGGEKHA